MAFQPRVVKQRGQEDTEPFTEREKLVRELFAEFIRSTRMALAKSRAWQRREAELTAKYSDPTNARIAKRDDLEMKDAMSGYVWHRDNAQFARDAITLLLHRSIREVINR